MGGRPEEAEGILVKGGAPPAGKRTGEGWGLIGAGGIECPFADLNVSVVAIVLADRGVCMRGVEDEEDCRGGKEGLDESAGCKW